MLAPESAAMGFPKDRHAMLPFGRPSVRVSRTGEIILGNNLGRLWPSCLIKGSRIKESLISDYCLADESRVTKNL